MKNQFKLLTLAASAAMMFTACSSDKLETYAGQPDLNPEAPSNAIQFGTYMGKKGSTRGGATGTITTDLLKTTSGAIKDAGFGVYALYTVGTDFDAVVDRTPNFMWNQKVASDGTNWTYNPVKYWPNGNSTADNTYNNATGTSGGKVSFFAYAPRVEVNDDGSFASAQTEGITAISGNTDKENPWVNYTLTTGESFVDLLWGTTLGNSETTYDVAQNGANVTTTTDGSSITSGVTPAGPTNINLTKQKIKDGTVNFLFKHSLSKVGGGTAKGNGTPSGISIMLDIDDLNGGADDSNTKVTVKKIKITTDADGDESVDTDEKIHESGILDLATGLWSFASVSDTKVVSMETSQTTNDYYELNNDIMEPTSAPAKSVAGFNGLPVGVQVTPKSIYKKTDVEGLVFFPGDAPKLRVTVDYFVRTKDEHLSGKYSEVEQIVTKVLQMPTLEMNKVYNLLIHIGLTSVKFTATVADWSDQDGSGSVDNATEVVLQEIWVPTNVLAVAAGSTTTVNISKTADAKFQFEVTGLGASEAWTASSSESWATVTASGTTASDGKAVIVVTPEKNTGASRSTTITVTKTSDSSTTTLTITQAAGN